MIKYKELSLPLKIGIILAYVTGGYYTLAFLVGIVIGIVEL